MYEEMKYITQEQHDKFEALLSLDNPNISELKEVVKILLNRVTVMGAKDYDPKFGDSRLCQCGHSYYRHFDTYENMAPVGCKYCHDCPTFKDSGKIQRFEGDIKIIEDYKG